MAFWQHFKEKDWGGPLAEVAHAAFLLFLDAIQIAALFGIATGLDLLLEALHVPPIKIYNFSIDATEIIKNFDYMLLVMFLVALVVRFGRILVNSR